MQFILTPQLSIQITDDNEVRLRQAIHSEDTDGNRPYPAVDPADLPVVISGFILARNLIAMDAVGKELYVVKGTHHTYGDVGYIRHRDVTAPHLGSEPGVEFVIVYEPRTAPSGHNGKYAEGRYGAFDRIHEKHLELFTGWPLPKYKS